MLTTAFGRSRIADTANIQNIIIIGFMAFVFSGTPNVYSFLSLFGLLIFPFTVSYFVIFVIIRIREVSVMEKVARFKVFDKDLAPGTDTTCQLRFRFMQRTLNL